MIETDNKLAISWLKNGIWALALASLYSIVLVILRTPQLSQIITDKSLFESSLVIHVNLSVLAWLLSMTCIIWSYRSQQLYVIHIFSKLALAGIALMTISPLIGHTNPIMNYYVPILENIWFVVGLSLFVSSILYFSILVFINSFNDFFLKEENNTAQILPVVKFTSLLMYIMVWGCLSLSYKDVMALSNFFPIEIDCYYELLFWSGGHMLQFVYTQIVMFVWLVLAELWIGKRLIYYKVYSSLFIINLILSLFVFYGHLVYQMPEYDFKAFFTKHTQYCGGIAPMLLIAVLIIDIFKIPTIKNNFTFASIALIASILVFVSGSLIGVFISERNLSIPAHYHGSIVGISIGFLGFAYMFCFCDSVFAIPDPILSKQLLTCSLSLKSLNDFTDTSSKYSKWPNIQLIIITVGQLLHIAELVLVGGYEILQKKIHKEIALVVKCYIGILGVGELIIIIGGLMFVYICAKRLYAL